MTKEIYLIIRTQRKDDIASSISSNFSIKTEYHKDGLKIEMVRSDQNVFLLGRIAEFLESYSATYEFGTAGETERKLSGN